MEEIMKSKKIVALVMSAAMVVGAASMFAACKPEEDGPGGTTGPEFQVDNEVYHCAGSSKGPEGSLYEQGWNEKAEGATEKVTFVKDAAVTNENVFKLEMKLYAGDEFKIVKATTGWTWELTTAAFVDAQEDATYNWVVKNDDDQIVFRSVSSSNSNITLNEGMDGIYEFTLKTNPAATEHADQYKISYKLVEKIDKLRIPYNMEVWGDLNGFGFGSNKIAMTNKDGIWSTVIDITEKDLVRKEDGTKITTDEEYTGTKYSAVYVSNVGDGETDEDVKVFVDANAKKATVRVDGEDVEANLLTAGKWNVTFDQNTKTVTFAEIKDDWNIVAGAKEVKLQAQTDGTWQGTLELTEAATGVKLVNKGGEDADVTIGDLAAGTWLVQYNPETGRVRYDTNSNYYIAGSINGWADAPKEGDAPKLTESETKGIWEVIVDWSTETNDILFKVVEGNFIEGATAWHGHWAENQHPDGNMNDHSEGGNFKVAPGKYRITFDASTKKIGYELITE